MIAVMERAAEIVTARVITVAPLLQRGLVRAAVAAGFTVVPAHERAHVTLRANGPPTGASDAEAGDCLDVVVESASVIVTVRHVPDLATVIRLHALLVTILEAGTS